MNKKAKKMMFMMLLPLVAIMFYACNGNNGKVRITEDEAEIQFDSLSHDYGFMPQDTVSVYEFVFYNIGGTPLHLEDVAPSCGCVLVDYPKGSIEPGEKGSITAKYNTHNRRPGHFNKSIRVYSNAKTSFVRLKVTGVVGEKTKEPKEKAKAKETEEQE